jgi:hypothetical protein
MRMDVPSSQYRMPVFVNNNQKFLAHTRRNTSMTARANLSDAEAAERRGIILALVGSLELVEVDPIVLERAAEPMPTELGTLDAIHLATALLWKDMTKANAEGPEVKRLLAPRLGQIGPRVRGM